MTLIAPMTRVAKIERHEPTSTLGVSHVRLTDGTSIRIPTHVVELMESTAGRLSNGQIAYSVDVAGNRHSPRPATDADRAIAGAGAV